MKKILALVLATVTALSCSMVAFASTTTLTTKVPAATYTLNIPADTEIVFNEERTELDPVTVTNASGFAKGKNLEVTVSYDDFKCEGVSTTIPYIFGVAKEDMDIGYYEISNNESLTFEGLSDGTIKEFATYTTPANENINATCTKTVIAIEPEDWGKALAGEYTTTITFTAKVVAE